uniref:Odorant receptor 6 n=1 Tax=Apriona germarii TaxID=157307 RepID=A0A7H9SPS9_APRGE|nr:odorant receptor 6 [Apriona germarii]
MDLNEVLSAPLALLITSNVTVFCMNMYVLSTSQNLTESCRTMVTTFALVFEYFMVFGLPAQLLMDEATSTADIIYQECKWYLPSVKPLRSDFLIMIMRSQKKNCIRAANYHIISNQTVLLMLKTAYTFYTFIQNVKM